MASREDQKPKTIVSEASSEITLSEEADADKLSGTMLGRYKVIARVAKGGTATVFKGTDTVLNRDVALKILHEHLESKGELASRFRKEAQYIAQLRHPNIVQVFDFLEAGSRAVVVVEYMPGVTLSNLINKTPRVYEDHVLMVGLEILYGLKAAHEAGITHRDIKPANILLHPDLGVKISDFGLAKLANGDDGLTKEGIFIGTPSFSSPEQIEGRAIDHRSDLFSLGLTLYMMATRRHAFKTHGDSTTTVWFKIVKGRFESVRDVDPNLSADLERILNRSLQVDLNKRYQAAQEMIQDIEAVLVKRNLMPYGNHLKKFLRDPLQAKPLSTHKWHWYQDKRLWGVAAAILLGLGTWFLAPSVLDFWKQRSRSQETRESQDLQPVLPPAAQEIKEVESEKAQDLTPPAQTPQEKVEDVVVQKEKQARPSTKKVSPPPPPALRERPLIPTRIPLTSSSKLVLVTGDSSPGLGFRWKGAGEFVLAKDKEFNQVIVKEDRKAESIDLLLTDLGTYFWKGGSQEFRLNVQDLLDYRSQNKPSKRPLIVASQFGDVDLEMNPWLQEIHFAWQTGPNASQYRLDIGADPQMKKLLFSGLFPTKTTVIERSWAHDQTAYWKVSYLDENRNVFFVDPPRRVNLKLKGASPYFDILQPEAREFISGQSLEVRVIGPDRSSVLCRLLAIGQDPAAFTTLEWNRIFFQGLVPIPSSARWLHCLQRGTQGTTDLVIPVRSQGQ